MTDLEKFTSLFDSVGVPHKMYNAYDADREDIAFTVKVGGYTHQSDPRKTVTGYTGFFTLYNFAADGKFICMGAWE